MLTTVSKDFQGMYTPVKITFPAYVSKVSDDINKCDWTSCGFFAQRINTPKIPKHTLSKQIPRENNMPHLYGIYALHLPLKAAKSTYKIIPECMVWCVKLTSHKKKQKTKKQNTHTHTSHFDWTCRLMVFVELPEGSESKGADGKLWRPLRRAFRVTKIEW